MRRLFLTLSLAATLVLSGCGGGGSSCGAEKQMFEITFASKSYTLKLNEPAKIASLISPESCRFAITLDTINGHLPQGLSFSNGDITGTPTSLGTSSFNVYMASIDGYEKPIPMVAPRSGTITITVVP